MYTLRDRGFDRGKNRFCTTVVVGAVDVGDLLETDKGPRRVSHLGRTFSNGEPPKCYAYFDIDPREIGAPVDSLTPEQVEAREFAREGLGEGQRKRREARDDEAAKAVLAALERDGWSNRSNTAAPQRALKRAYAELVAAGVIELKRYRYVLATGATGPTGAEHMSDEELDAAIRAQRNT